tara:strand:+ start:217 stop:864 length:648 start_codon:yes stop_codon:yes gene_type:complete
MALPLLLIYEILIFFTESNYWVIRNAADVWIRKFLMAFEIKAQHLTFVMIGILFFLIPLAKNRSPGVRIKISYFLIMLLESFLYSIILGMVLQFILNLGGLSTVGLGNNLLQNIALSIGAGLFEEIFFRVFLLNLFIFIFKPFFKKIFFNVVLAVLASSLLFSISHYVGSMADSWNLYSFMFRWFAGILFAILYFMRGFSITAYTHALYDIWVIV